MYLTIVVWGGDLCFDICYVWFGVIWFSTCLVLFYGGGFVLICFGCLLFCDLKWLLCVWLVFSCLLIFWFVWILVSWLFCLYLFVGVICLILFSVWVGLVIDFELLWLCWLWNRCCGLDFVLWFWFIVVMLVRFCFGWWVANDCCLLSSFVLYLSCVYVFLVFGFGYAF